MKKVLAFLFLAVTTVSPALAACTPRGCVIGPCMVFDLMTDYSFNDNCAQWKWSSSAHRVYIKGWSGQLDKASPSGRIYQSVDMGYGYSSYEVNFKLEVEKCSVGSETLYVEIRRPSDDTLLETVAVLPASSTNNGTYSKVLTGSYANQIVNLVFRQVGGSGDTEFRVTQVSLWASL